ncbi:MAG: hypothetical protein ACHQQS_12430 [Thermoanaerobaculales bacterium]
MSSSSGWRVGVVAVVVAMVVIPAFAGFSGTDLVLPSIGNRPGALSSNWHTLVWVYNPGASTANITVYFLERDVSNPTPPHAPLVVGPGQTFRSSSIIEDLFGFQKWGALRFVSTSDVVVTCRMYNLPASGNDASTTGQDYAGIPASFAIGAGQSTQLLGVSQNTPVTSGMFRYSFGWVETTGNSVNVRVTAYNGDGSVAGGPTDYPTDPFESRYYPIDNLIPTVNSTNLRLKVEVTSGSGKIVAVGSGVANTSTDGTTFEMQFPASALGISAVAHDGTLTGDGTGGNPLGLAIGGVTKGYLSASGGSAGQVLGTDGTNLVWQAGGGGGLTLPFSGAASSAALTDLFTIQNSGAGRAIHGITSTDTAVWGQSTGSGWGVAGWTLNTIGVQGWAAGTTGASTGVWGQTESTTTLARGVVGWAHATSGQTAGVWGQTQSTDLNSAGVYGWANGGYGVGGYSVGYYGVLGVQGAASGTYDANRRGGVWGDSTDGQGVLGTSKNTVGVSGMSVTRYGVQGISLGSSGANSSAIIGFAYGSPPGPAGYFSGDVHLTGTLTGGTKSFMIDHPVDPANKYLYHVSVESPDMMNIYNGNVTTDGIGQATVTMPDYFSALNRDFRYQLTVIGQFAQAIVAGEIENNQFTVKTDKPYVKVSWQVTGIRKDAYANAHRIQVEVDKPENERGYYIHPELFGQPEEMGIEWVHNPELMRSMKEMREKNQQQK